MEKILGLDINPSDAVYRDDSGVYVKTRVLLRNLGDGVDPISATNSIALVVSGSVCDELGKALPLPNQPGWQIAPGFTHTVNVAGLLAGGQSLEEYVENARLKCAFETARLPAVVNVLAQFVIEGAAASTSVATPPVPFNTAASKLREVNTAYNAAIEALVGDTPEPERLTWVDQEREARGLLAGDTTATPVLSAIADARGLALLTLAERVVAKADSYRVASARLTGLRQAYEDRINAGEFEFMVSYELTGM